MNDKNITCICDKKIDLNNKTSVCYNNCGTYYCDNCDIEFYFENIIKHDIGNSEKSDTKKFIFRHNSICGNKN